MHPKGIHHVSITVDEIEPAVAFYRLLGLQPAPRPDLGIPGAWLDAGGAQIHLLESADAGPHRFIDHFALEVSDLDSAVAELISAGVAVDGPSNIGSVGRQAFVVDPSGNTVELNQPSAPAPQSPR